MNKILACAVVLGMLAVPASFAFADDHASHEAEHHADTHADTHDDHAADHAADHQASPSGGQAAHDADHAATHEPEHPAPIEQAGLAITQLAGPSELAVGQSGTWTVALAASSTANIFVFVSWGDQLFDFHPASAQNAGTTTFAHAYAQPGAYTLTVMAIDRAGRLARASAAVVVGTTTASL